jgi:ABC-2 type transport system permease protein
MLRKKTNREYPLAALIHGKPKAEAESSSEETEGEDAAGASKPDDKGVNVILVADIDVLASAFFEIRKRGEDPEAMINLQPDNVTFVLNSLDMLAKDDRFIAVRNRRPAHRTLTLIEEMVAGAKADAMEARRKFNQEFTDAKDAAQAAFDAKIKAIEDDTSLDSATQERKILLVREVEQRRLQNNTERLQRERDAKIRLAERVQDQQIRAIQNSQRGWALIVSVLLPLAPGLMVWISRRMGETEGVAKSRLRS